MKGQIVSVAADGASMVVTTGGKKNATQTTVQIAPTCKVTLDGADKQVGDLKAGEYVLVKSSAGSATTITATMDKPAEKAK